jgi:hypothetical protein
MARSMARHFLLRRSNFFRWCQFSTRIPASIGETRNRGRSPREGSKEDDVMLKSRLVVVSSMLVLAGLLGAASVARGNVSDVNYLTFSAPFALPGVTLPAGTYTFELAIPGSYDVVRVMSRDRGHVYLTAFTKRVDRPRGLPGNRQIVFQEAPAGAAPPIRTWFPIGQSIGHEFLYDAGSRQLAQATN